MNNNTQDDDHSEKNSLNLMLDMIELVGTEDDDNSLNSILDMIELDDQLEYHTTLLQDNDSNGSLYDDNETVTDDVNDAPCNTTGYKLVQFAKIAKTMSAMTVCKQCAEHVNPIVSSLMCTLRSIGLATIITGRCNANALDSKRVSHEFCVLPDEVSNLRNNRKSTTKNSIANYSIKWSATAAMHPIGGGWTELCTMFAFMGVLSAAFSPRPRMVIEDELGVAE